MKNVKRARQALAQDQAAWNNTMHKNKGKYIANKVHYVLSDETLACGMEWFMENVGCDDIADVTCNACITAHADMEHTEKEASSMASTKNVTLYTLAPATLDKPGTESVGSSWFYSDSNVPEQALREVIVPQTEMVAQMQAYRLRVPYITFSEDGLSKALTKGLVYRAEVSGIAFDPIKAAIELSNNNKKEVSPMPRKPKVIVTPQVKAVPSMTPLGVAPVPSALDAILAMPMRLAEDAAAVKALVPANTPEGRQHAARAELTTRMDTPKKPLALPEERSETKLAHSLAPAMAAYSLAHDPFYVQLAQLVQGLQSKVASLEERLFLAEQVDYVPQPARTMHDILSNAWNDIIGSVDMPAPAPVVPDAWGEMLGDVQAPAKPKSTLRVFTNGTTSTKGGKKGGSKTDPAIIQAIQRAWNSGKTTQAALATRYGMDEKKVWYFCNRAKQLV